MRSPHRSPSIPNRRVALALALAAGLALFSLSGRAEDPPGKTLLFDGKSLDGWKKVDSFKAGEVKVDRGAIVLGEGGPMTAVVCTRAELPKSRYELTFEARRVAGSDFFAAATFPVGASFLTLVNGGWGGSITGLSSLNGADASENETNHFVKYENGKWYRFRVRVTDAVVRCRLDDEEIIAVRYEGQQVKTRLEVRSCQPLGFASWRCSGEVRGIEIRPLTDAEVEEADKLE